MQPTSRSAAEPRLIKRYPNRKLYDTLERQYIGLEDVTDLIEQGAEVRIVEHPTLRDVTRTTLIAVLLRRAKSASDLDERTLHRLICRQAGASLATLDSAPEGSASAAARQRGEASSEAEQRLRDLVGRARRARDRAEATWDSSQTAVAGLQHKLNERLGMAWSVVADLGRVNRELRYLRGRLDALDERLRDLRPEQAPWEAETDGLARRA